MPCNILWTPDSIAAMFFHGEYKVHIYKDPINEITHGVKKTHRNEDVEGSDDDPQASEGRRSCVQPTTHVHRDRQRFPRNLNSPKTCQMPRVQVTNHLSTVSLSICLPLRITCHVCFHLSKVSCSIQPILALILCSHLISIPTSLDPHHRPTLTSTSWPPHWWEDISRFSSCFDTFTTSCKRVSSLSLSAKPQCCALPKPQLFFLLCHCTALWSSPTPKFSLSSYDIEMFTCKPALYIPVLRDFQILLLLIITKIWPSFSSKSSFSFCQCWKQIIKLTCLPFSTFRLIRPSLTVLDAWKLQWDGLLLLIHLLHLLPSTFAKPDNQWLSSVSTRCQNLQLQASCPDLRRVGSWREVCWRMMLRPGLSADWPQCRHSE